MGCELHVCRGAPSDLTHPGKTRKKGVSDVPRIDFTRIYLTTGQRSAKTYRKIVNRGEAGPKAAFDTVNDAFVSVRGS
jgi:hypothetical protein